MVGQNMYSVDISEESITSKRVDSVFEVGNDSRLLVQAGDAVGVLVELGAVRCPDIQVHIAGIRNVNIATTIFHRHISSASIYALMTIMSNPYRYLLVSQSTIPFLTAAIVGRLIRILI